MKIDSSHGLKESIYASFYPVIMDLDRFRGVS